MDREFDVHTAPIDGLCVLIKVVAWILAMKRSTLNNFMLMQRLLRKHEIRDRANKAEASVLKVTKTHHGVLIDTAVEIKTFTTQRTIHDANILKVHWCMQRRNMVSL